MKVPKFKIVVSQSTCDLDDHVLTIFCELPLEDVLLRLLGSFSLALSEASKRRLEYRVRGLADDSAYEAEEAEKE